MSKLTHLKKAPLIVALSLAGMLAAHAAAPLIGDSPFEQAVAALRVASTPDARQAAMAQLEQLAAAGDGRAAMHLAELALADVQLAGDLAYERALRYLDLAVAADVDGAAVKRAVATARRGIHAGKDTAAGSALLAQAQPLLEAQVDSGDPELLWILGYLESTGLGGRQDVVAGALHIEDAAIGGQAAAAFWTANRYANAIPAEPEAEQRFLEIAAAGGVRGAQERLDKLAVARVFENSGSIAPAMAQGAIDFAQAIQVASADLGAASGHAPSTSTVTVAAVAPTPRASVVIEDDASDAVLDLRIRLDAATRELADLRKQLAAAEARAQAPAGPSPDELVALNNEGLQAVLEGNYELALQRFRVAAQADFAPAQSNLGLLYLNGSSVPQDGRQAAKLFEQAAKQGNVTAAENLGKIYAEGLGIHADRSRAIHWYERAAELGSAIAPVAIDQLRAN